MTDKNPETIPIDQLCRPISATVMPKGTSWGNIQQKDKGGPTLQAQRQSAINGFTRKMRDAQKRTKK